MWRYHPPTMGRRERRLGTRGRRVAFCLVLGVVIGPGWGVGMGALAAPDAPETEPLVVFLGDSLTAGLGLSETEAFPALVGGLLRDHDLKIRIVNAGISGDTTAGGLGRLGWLLRQEPTVLVVGLGANDGLRGLPLDATEENLRRIVSGARSAGARVLLLGMKIPPSYGRDYAEGFAAVYPAIATDLEVALVPFLLEGVAADPVLNQGDGIHPNAAGHRRMAELVAPHLEGLLQPPRRP